jgi:hypothetical protein
MKEGSYSQRIDFGDFTKGGKRRQRTYQFPPFQRQSHSKDEQGARREEGRQYHTGMTPDEQEEHRRKQQEDKNKFREIFFSYHKRPLSEDEWEFLESRPYFIYYNEIKKEFSIEEELQYSNTPKYIQEGLRKRATEYIKGYLRDRYPSWWEVWDENGKPITRMSPQHKATLARMRHFDSLSPEEKYEELKRTFPNLFMQKDENPGERFARVIDGLFEILLSLFRSPEDRDQTEYQPA